MIELKDYNIDERHLHPYFGHPNSNEMEHFEIDENHLHPFFGYPDPNELEPFDKVLVRNREWHCWKIQFYSHKSVNEEYPYVCMDECAYSQCVKYTKETCHLLNTKESLNSPESEPEYRFGDKNS